MSREYALDGEHSDQSMLHQVPPCFQSQIFVALFTRIQIQRIKPGCPQQNGRHERMHLTLKQEATKPASFNLRQQQERFDRFIAVYNHERPHQALGGSYPGDLYTPSVRVYAPPPEPEYPYHDKSVRVTHCGRICVGRRKIKLSRVFAGQIVGIREVDDQIWLA